MPGEALHIVAPFARGGATDLVTRIYADALAERLDTAIDITNEPGDGGTRGAERVARAPADGRTVVMGTSSTHGICSAVFDDVPYDWQRDFMPVAPVVRAPGVLIVSSGGGIRTVADLVEKARAHPGELTFGSAGFGQTIHLCGELFKAAAAIDVVHAPRIGSAAALEDLAAGRLTMMFDNILSALPYIRDGRLRALAVTSAARAPQLADVPAMQECGIRDYDLSAWIGLLARTGTPESAIERLEEATRDVLGSLALQRRLDDMGAEVMFQTRGEFGAFMEAEARKWARVVQSCGVR